MAIYPSFQIRLQFPFLTHCKSLNAVRDIEIYRPSQNTYFAIRSLANLSEQAEFDLNFRQTATP